MERDAEVGLLFEGGVDEAYDLVDDLRASDIAVQWDPPVQMRGQMLNEIFVAIVASGLTDVVRGVVAAFLRKHPHSKVREAPREDEDTSTEHQ